RRVALWTVGTALFLFSRLYPWPACGDPHRRPMPSSYSMVQVSPFTSVFIRRLCLLLACLSTLFTTGCSHRDGQGIITQFREGKPQEFLQTSVDRMATLAMRDNLDSLY